MTECVPLPPCDYAPLLLPPPPLCIRIEVCSEDAEPGSRSRAICMGEQAFFMPLLLTSTLGGVSHYLISLWYR